MYNLVGFKFEKLLLPSFLNSNGMPEVTFVWPHLNSRQVYDFDIILYEIHFQNNIIITIE